MALRQAVRFSVSIGCLLCIRLAMKDRAAQPHIITTQLKTSDAGIISRCLMFAVYSQASTSVHPTTVMRLVALCFSRYLICPISI